MVEGLCLPACLVFKGVGRCPPGFPGCSPASRTWAHVSGVSAGVGLVDSSPGPCSSRRSCSLHTVVPGIVRTVLCRLCPHCAVSVGVGMMLSSLFWGDGSEDTLGSCRTCLPSWVSVPMFLELAGHCSGAQHWYPADPVVSSGLVDL